MKIPMINIIFAQCSESHGSCAPRQVHMQRLATGCVVEFVASRCPRPSTAGIKAGGLLGPPTGGISTAMTRDFSRAVTSVSVLFIIEGEAVVELVRRGGESGR